MDVRLADATLRLLEKTDWSRLTLAAVVRGAKVSWPETFAVAPSKPALAGLVLRRIADETARRYRRDRASQSARERVFDVCMTWFDAQQKRKRSLHALYNGLRGNPLALLSSRNAIVGTAGIVLALAEADAGALEPAGATILAGILARATFTWLEDDEAMSRTMAQLDRDLRRAETVLWRKQSRSKAARKK